MKNLSAAVLVMLLPACVSPSAPRTPESERSLSPDSRIAAADAAALVVSDDLVNHRFADVQGRMEESYRRRTSASDLAAEWARVESECGRHLRTVLRNDHDRFDDFPSALRHESRISPTGLAWHFERGIVKASIAVEEDGTISHFRIYPTHAVSGFRICPDTEAPDTRPPGAG